MSEGSISNEFATIHEIIKTARMNLTQGAWDYMAGASESETTMKRNRRAFDKLALKPRTMRDVREIDTSETIFGMKLKIPVILAPIGSLETFSPVGGAADSARAAEEAGICHMLSSRCAPGLEEVAAAANNYRIFQLYVRGDTDFEDDHARRAIDNGYHAFAALCEAAGYEGPLNRCSIYQSAEAGARLKEMLAMGSSRPWPEALEALTGQRQMDATAIRDYFAPLTVWLEEQNAGRSCGW